MSVKKTVFYNNSLFCLSLTTSEQKILCAPPARVYSVGFKEVWGVVEGHLSIDIKEKRWDTFFEHQTVTCRKKTLKKEIKVIMSEEEKSFKNTRPEAYEIGF